MQLSDSEINTYHQDGLVTPSSCRVPPSARARIEQLYKKLTEDNNKNPESFPDFILGPRLAGKESYGIKGGPAWLEITRMPEILDMVEQLIGIDFGQNTH